MTDDDGPADGMLDGLADGIVVGEYSGCCDVGAPVVGVVAVSARSLVGVRLDATCELGRGVVRAPDVGCSTVSGACVGPELGGSTAHDGAPVVGSPLVGVWLDAAPDDCRALVSSCRLVSSC